MTGVFNSNPPKPRYLFIWDIEKVLTFTKRMPNNKELSDRHINLKLAIFLVFTSAGWCHEICYLNINLMVRTSTSFRLFFTKVTKSWRKGKPPTCLEFRKYSDDKKLYVVACINEYLRRSIIPYGTQGQNQLLISHLISFKEVLSSTLANWVKLVLKMAEIVTSL